MSDVVRTPTRSAFRNRLLTSWIPDISIVCRMELVYSAQITLVRPLIDCICGALTNVAGAMSRGLSGVRGPFPLVQRLC